MDELAPLSFLPLRLTRNPMAYTIDAVSDSIADRTNLSYLLCLKKPKAYGSGEYNELITLPGRELPKRQELGADIFPGAQFDVSVFLDDFLKRTPPQPNQTGIVTCGDMITPYLTQIRVENNGVLVPGSEKTLPLEYAFKGALSIEQFAGWRDAFFTTYLSQSRQFLTWQPAEKWVDVAQPEFLYYLVNFTPKPTELRLRVELAYTDGTLNRYTAQRMTTVSQYVVYSIPVGFNALGLSAIEQQYGKVVHSYKFWLSNEANQRLSEVRTYYVNRDFEHNVLYLLFANSLGGYDTLRCTGQSDRSLTIKGTDVQRSLDPSYLPSTAELLRLNRYAEKTLTVATGLRDGDELDYLSEVVLSEELYVVTREGFVALTLSTSGDTVLGLRQDEENLAGRSLTFRYAKNEVGYSSLPQPPTTPARATRWVPVNTFCLIDDNGLRTGMLGAAKLELRYADDGTLVKPLRSKSNIPGTEGYTPPIASAQCQTTPFVNALIQKPGSFRRNNCGADQESTVATLTIPAGTYGADTAEQLQSRIDQALKVMDTQEYANLYGSCLANPALYAYNGPANTWHYRSGNASRSTIYYAQEPVAGNSWNVQGQSGQYIYPQYSNDLDFGTGGLMTAWLMFVYGTPSKQVQLKVWVNGVVKRDTIITMNPDGYELTYMLANAFDQPLHTLISGDRVYVQLIDL